MPERNSIAYLKRVDAALNAAAELEAIFVGLLDQAKKDDIYGGEPKPLSPPIVRAVAGRGRDLARAVLGALDDDLQPIADIERTVSNG